MSLTPAQQRRLFRLNGLTRAERAAVLNPQTPAEVLAATTGRIADDHPGATIEDRSTPDVAGAMVSLPDGSRHAVWVDPEGLPTSALIDRRP